MPELRYRSPNVFFVLAVFGMTAVTGVALDAAGRLDLVPSPLHEHFIAPYVRPLSATLFGINWGPTVQVIAVLAWIIHLMETVYVQHTINVAISGGTRVAGSTRVFYLLGTFFGGMSQISTFGKALTIARKTK